MTNDTSAVKSREEILREEYGKLIVNPEKAYSQNPTLIRAAHTAMDEYAKQEAIRFANWINTEQYIQWFPTDLWNKDNDKKEYTTEQLYNLYLQSKK